MVRTGVNRAVRKKGTNGLDRSKVWEHVRNQGRKGVFFFFYI